MISESPADRLEWLYSSVSGSDSAETTGQSSFNCIQAVLQYITTVLEYTSLQRRHQNVTTSKCDLSDQHDTDCLAWSSASMIASAYRPGRLRERRRQAKLVAPLPVMPARSPSVVLGQLRPHLCPSRGTPAPTLLAICGAERRRLVCPADSPRLPADTSALPAFESGHHRNGADGIEQ